MTTNRSVSRSLSLQLARAGAGAVIADSGDRTLAIVALPAKRGERAVLDVLRVAPARIALSRIVTAERLVSAVHETRRGRHSPRRMPPGASPGPLRGARCVAVAHDRRGYA